MFCSRVQNVHGLSILINFSGCETFQRPGFMQQILCHRLRISDFFLLMMQYKLGNQFCIYSSAEVWAPFISAFCGNNCDLFKAFKLQFPTADVVEADIHGNQSKWARVAVQRVGSVLLSNSYRIPPTWALPPSSVVWGLVLVSWGVLLPFTVPASYSLSFIFPPYGAFKEETLLFLWPSSASSKMSWLNPCGMTASHGPLLTAANSFSSHQVILKQELWSCIGG